MASDTLEAAHSAADILAALTSGHVERALGMVNAAIGAGATDPLYYRLRAVCAERYGDFAAAVLDLERALLAAPADAALLNTLGLCNGRLGRRPEALQYLSLAVQLQPDLAAAYANRAWVLEGLGELKAARGDYEQAVALDPDQPFVFAALAMMAARQGDWPAARSHADRALANGAFAPTAVIALAIADAGEGRADAGRIRLDALLSTARLSEQDQGMAEGVQADLLDRLGETEAAFRLYAQANLNVAAANAASVAHWRAHGARSLGRRLLDTPIDRLQLEGAESHATDPRAPHTHVFLIGFPRSGTTLLGQVLASHADVSTLDERENLADAAHAFLQDAAGLRRLAMLDPETADAYRRLYWDRVAAGIGSPGAVFIDKLPMNILGLPVIHRLFPKALIMHSLRDPRDVVLSCFRQRFAPGPSTVEFLQLDTAAGFYNEVMTLCFRLLAASPMSSLTHRHETLVGDFEAETRRLCAFLGIEWSRSMEDFAVQAQGRDIATPSSGDINLGLSDRSIGRWRGYEAQLQSVLPVLEPWVRRLGYA